MPEPKSLQFGQPTPTAAPLPPPIQDMQIAPATQGQQLAVQRPFDMQEVMTFGQDVEVRASSVVQKINASTRAGDLDEVGKSLNALTMAGMQYDPAKLGKSGIMGFFKKKKRELETHYKSVDAQVNTIAADLERQVGHFNGRVGDLANLAIENRQRHADLGKKMEECDRRATWMELNPPAVVADDPFSAQHKATWDQVIGYARKRIEDMRSSRVLCEMTDSQISMMAQNAGMLIMTFGEVKTMTLPQMQMSFSLFIMNMEAEKGANFAKSVRDTNNELIKRNADKLGTATVLVRQEMGRASVDLSTLQHAKDKFFETLDKVKEIEAQTKTRLATERPQIEAMSAEIAKRLNQ